MDILNTNSGFQKTRRFVGQKLRNLGVRYSKAGTVQIWRERARVFVARGEIDQAIDCRRNVVKLDPSNPQWRMELVRELLLAGRAEEAKAADGGVAFVWRMLAQELNSQHEDRLALYCWRRAMDLDPSASHAQQELVRTFITKRQAIDEAQPDFENDQAEQDAAQHQQQIF